AHERHRLAGWQVLTLRPDAARKVNESVGWRLHKGHHQEQVVHDVSSMAGSPRMREGCGGESQPRTQTSCQGGCARAVMRGSRKRGFARRCAGRNQPAIGARLKELPERNSAELQALTNGSPEVKALDSWLWLRDFGTSR